MALIKPDEWQASGVEDLEPAAWEVVRSMSNKSVIAGPGAGKTELLAQRACYLLQTGLCRSPKRILAISFKKDAARNLKERVLQRTSTREASRFDSYTFDAFSKSILDRFYLTLPENWKIGPSYEPVSYGYRDWTEFINATNVPREFGSVDLLHQMKWEVFYKDFLLGSSLPIGGITPETIYMWAAQKWWSNCRSIEGSSKLTFPMMGRLAEVILRSNKYLSKALQQTYQYVFLDEFQDTTHVQFDLLQTAFVSSKAVLTAVGDHKQQIMKWAMALDDPFQLYQERFNGSSVALVRNYRSSSELVRIQDAVATIVDPDSNVTEAMQQTTIEGDVCSILQFEDANHEAEYIANLILETIREHDLNPRDFAILVKQKIVDFVPALEEVFSGSGIVARDESVIQDLLTDNFCKVSLLCLRLAIGCKEKQKKWRELTELTAFIKGIDIEDTNVGGFYKKLDTFLNRLESTCLDLPENKNDILALLSEIINFFSKKSLKATYPEYRREEWFEQVVETMAVYLFRYAAGSSFWEELLDSFEGVNSVPIMTIHKCKGLEFHTVFFLALEDGSWWSFRRDPEESKSAFFVAFSRAKQRIIFTTRRGDSRTLVGGLYKILVDAGVPAEIVPRE